jgi:hypothetical protein
MSINRSENRTKGSITFDLIRLFVGGLHQGSNDLTISRNNVLLDTDSGIETLGLSGIIVLESEINKIGARVTVMLKGSIIAKPNLQLPYSLFYSYKQKDLSYYLKLAESSLWSLGSSNFKDLQFVPIVLHNTVFEVDLFSHDRFGYDLQIASGRGFLLFDDIPRREAD